MNRRELDEKYPHDLRKRHIRLTFNKGKSNKFYEALVTAIDHLATPSAPPGQWAVVFRWGRTTVFENSEVQEEHFTNLVDAMNAFDRKVKSEKAKGYETQWYKPNGRDIDNERSVEEDAAPTKKHFEPSKSDEKYDDLQQQRKDEASW